MPDVFNLCSPNHDTESHTLVVVYVNLLTFLIEFDTVQSIVMQIFNNNLSDKFCDNKAQKALVWSFYGSMVGIFWTIQLLVIIIFIISASCPQHKEKNYPFTVILTCNTCYVARNVVLSVGVTLAVASTLLAEIPQLLQCYIPQEIHILVSFALSLLTFLVCLMVCVGFLVRKVCGCVRVKGELEVVNVTEHEIKVTYEVKYPCCEGSRCTYKSSETHTCIYTVNESE